MRGLGLLAAAVMAAGSAMPVAAQQEERPPVPEMMAYTSYRTPGVDGTGAALMREPALDRRQRTIPGDVYPQHLLAEPGRRQEAVNVLVSLDSTGQPSACQPNGGDVHVDQRWLDEPVSPGLHALVCTLAMEDFGYHHALGADGQPVAAIVAVEARFGWQNYFRVSPAPAPSASDVVSVDGWPMRYPPQVPAGARLPLPDGSDFVARDRSRPRRASVGLLFSTDAARRLTECRVARPSGIVDYDDASCRVLAAAALPGPLTDFPVLLHWNRQQVAAQLPTARPQGPVMATVPRADPARIAGIVLPQNPSVDVELRVSPEGTLAGCVVTGPSYIDALDAASCAAFAPDTRFTPARGNFGEPVTGILRMTINWRDLTIRRDGW